MSPSSIALVLAACIVAAGTACAQGVNTQNGSGGSLNGVGGQPNGSGGQPNGTGGQSNGMGGAPNGVGGLQNGARQPSATQPNVIDGGSAGQ